MYYTVSPDALAEVEEAVGALASVPTAAERRSGCC
jgi:hypothetical protein